jgi:hypothetical protein
VLGPFIEVVSASSVTATLLSPDSTRRSTLLPASWQVKIVDQRWMNRITCADKEFGGFPFTQYLADDQRYLRPNTGRFAQFNALLVVIIDVVKEMSLADVQATAEERLVSQRDRYR